MKPTYPPNYPYNIYETHSANNHHLSTFESDFQNAKRIRKKNQCQSIFENTFTRQLCWWEPNQDSLLPEFLGASSIIGLKYISEPKRHLIERIFWLCAFFTSVIGGFFMIKTIWEAYIANPVIVTFNPQEILIENFPFPAVTICNSSPFQISTVNEFVRQYIESESDEEQRDALDKLRLINAICSTKQSFLKSFNYTERGEIEGVPEAKGNPSRELERNLTQFLLQNSQPCKELIRRCLWHRKEYPCQKLFKPIITDSGKCCTFNMLPRQLLERYSHGRELKVFEFENGTLNLDKGKSAWSKQNIIEWQKWDYTNDGYILPSKLKYPWRQREASIQDGLSILLDPDLNNSFCSSLDSYGVKVHFHVPLDVPKVAELGHVIALGKEVFVKINNDLTIADDEIQAIPSEARKCRFGKESKLKFYKPYTRNNCMLECWSEIVFRKCGCVLYYLPRNATTNVCGTHPGSKENECVKKYQKMFLGDKMFRKKCSRCTYSCNELKFKTALTMSELMPNQQLWQFPFLSDEHEQIMNRQFSILHVFIGADSTVPKLRRKMYQAVDLIANTGGLLGLTIGFSILSAVEILYFGTMRIFCRKLRKSKKYGPVK